MECIFSQKNVGVAHCKGDVVLFVDDDDTPLGDNWIADHAKNYIDPFCIGVNGRHIHQLNEVSRYKDINYAYKRCLTISFMGRGRVFTGNTNNNHIKLSIPQFCLSRHFIITIDEFNSYFFNSLTYVLTFKIVNDMGYWCWERITTPKSKLLNDRQKIGKVIEMVCFKKNWLHEISVQSI